MPLKVCAVTGGRADWSLLSVPLAALRDDPAFDLSLLVTGQHLMPGNGDTCAAIEADGFRIEDRIDMLLGSDTPAAVTKALGLATIGFADALARLQPDLILILGDRYELLAVTQAALLARIPVAHLCGGDLTEGALDDAVRHAVTKMSHLHFVSSPDAARRVRQLGEDPQAIHCVGSPGLDRIRLTPPLDRAAFFASVEMSPAERLLLITYHPVTLDADPAAGCAEMLAALADLGPEVALLFTGVNADPGGRGVAEQIAAFVAAHPNARQFASLGARRYYSALTHAAAVVGNSSSGLYEAPTFAVPTVNIGDRQGGRLRAASVIDCPPQRAAIRAALERAFAGDWSGVVNPYGDGHATERILAVLKALPDPRSLLKKRFFDLEDA